MFTGRYVSNPTVSGDTLYATMHMCNPGCVRWIEVGWYKFPGGSRGVFTYSTDWGFRDFGSYYTIYTGQILHMELVWNGSGSIPGHYAYLWWNNQWNLLDAFSIGDPYAAGRSDLVYEAFTNSTHLVLPNTQVDGTLLEVPTCPPCTWVNWDDQIIGTYVVNDSPYHSHFQNLYYKWYGHSH